MRLAEAALALALALAFAGCKQERQQAPTRRAFTGSDLAAAAAVDARLARVTLLASSLQLATDEAPAELPSRAAALEPRLAVAVADAERALADVTHPGDRELAEHAVEVARRWPGLAHELRQSGTGSAASLQRPRDELGRAVFAYRRARSQYPLEAAAEVGPSLAFAQARAGLERSEAEAGQRLPVAPRDKGHELDLTATRRSAHSAADHAREAAGRLGAELKGPALRWVKAESEAVQALIALPVAPAARRGTHSLHYQEAKADALDALAEYERIRAR